jgi:hypothetical protein
MDTSRLAAALAGLPPAAQVESLLRLAFELTLLGRDTYEPSSLDLRHPQRLRSLNEVQHRVVSQARAVLTGDAARYPDDVFTAIIVDQDDPELRRQIAWAFARCLPLPSVA